MNDLSLAVWFHVMAGIVWIGLLYYFNFVQVPGMAKAKADGTAAGIATHIAPRALLWFRWAAVVTWVTGAGALSLTVGFVEAFTFANQAATYIGIGAWLGTIMLFNVWVLIWPNQKKVLGMVQASDEEKAKAARTALLASRTNTALSIPMLMSMVGYGHAGFPL
ncbi:MAG: urate hydroxylase PuuD [Gammaproteobacteria bacterium]|nr:urate hydroxylase PuuD [Gammaproteobacteria bacterium]